MDFASDNAAGADPKILAALVAANAHPWPAYGEDPYTRRAADMVSALFERDCAVYFVATGTGANALALAALSPPWGAIFCHEDSHIIDDECGAPEFFAGGAKLVGIPGRYGKLAPDDLQRALDAYPRGLVKQVQPAALSLSQATESGALYTPAEIAGLAQRAQAAGVRLHMDGARFANAVAALGCTPAELTWKAGVAALSFGATKNGALACEAVVFFDKALAQDFAYRRKRGGHLLSKGRLLGAQMIAYLEDDFWLDRARRANASAARLAEGLAGVPGVRLPWPPQVNEIFAVLPRRIDAALKRAGARYYDWGTRGLTAAEQPRPDEVFVRLVASCATRDFEVARFIEVCRAAAGAP